MQKTAISITLLAVLLLSTFSATIILDEAKAATDFSGIITTDTTWTKANSPYTLTGPTAVNIETTLTIEPGVTVNLNGYYIRVNGTFTAIGANTDNIHLKAGLDGYIEFTSSSTEWNPQTGDGCIIENAIVEAEMRNQNSCFFVSNNTITKGMIAGGRSVVSKNIIAVDGSEAYAISVSGVAQVVDNTISGDFEQATIYIAGGSPTIQRNKISNTYGYSGDPGYEQSGITISEDASPTIKQNTITQCANGIRIGGSPTPIIANNNIERITNFNLYMGSRTVNIGVANNWWDSTNITLIDQKIYDYNDDFNLGKVNYTPILTAPNPQAIPDPNAPVPTPLESSTPSQSSSPIPNQSPSETASPTLNPTTSPDTTNSQGVSWGLFYGVVAVFVVAVAVLSVAVVLLLRRTRKVTET
jgi:parallel beta-helix repeat protein